MANYNTSYSLISAVRDGRLERARELINSFGLSYSQAWSKGYVLLCEATKKKHTAIIKLLLTNGSKVNSNRKKLSNTPLHFAVINGDIEIVKMLLDRGANINAKNQDGITALHNAIEHKKMEITELLLNRGANVNARNNDRITPLHIPAKRRENYTLYHVGNVIRYIVNTNDDMKIVTILLNRGANIDVKDQYGRTPLHNAIENDKMEITKLLLNHGANVNTRNNDGITPLHVAAEKGYSQIVEYLLKHGAFAHVFTFKEGYTPLHFAVENGQQKIVELLLECGANVDAQDNDGKSILHFAVEKGHLGIIEHILKYSPNINNKSNRSSISAAVHGYGKEYRKIVQNLLQYGFTINFEDVNNWNLLHAAVEKGHLGIVEELLKYGIDVNMLSSKKGCTPLHIATKHKHEEIAKLLITYGADVNAKDITGKTPIFYATEIADLKITKLLLTNRANVKDNPELLNIAVKKNCRKIVEIFLQHGADINASDEYGRTALHFTALSKDEEEFLYKDPDNSVNEGIAKLLLSRGANVNAQTKNSITTLHAASKNGYEKVVRALLEYNADVNSVDRNDTTPLHFSARKGNEVISKMLLNKGANVNAKQTDGITALHIATQNGHEEVVKVLLKYGAKVHSKVNSDITLIHIAAQKGYLKIVEILLKYGADIDSRDEYGRTALHIASEEGHIQTVSGLLQHGSDINIINKNGYTPLDVAIKHCYQIDKIFKCHIVKMKTANLYVSKENLRRVNSTYEMRDFQNKCEEEVAIMKSEKISDTNISFYDILTKSTNQLAICLRNENIVQVLNSNNYKTKFSIYASMIEHHFRKGMKRKELEQGNKTFYFLLNNFFELPHDCIEKIFSYLSDKDLRILMYACKPASVNNPNTDINDVAIISNLKSRLS